jgi:hypothetical protein
MGTRRAVAVPVIRWGVCQDGTEMHPDDVAIVDRLERVIEDLLNAAGAARPGYDLESTQGRAIEALRALRKTRAGERPNATMFRIMRDRRQISVSVDKNGVIVRMDDETAAEVGANGAPADFLFERERAWAEIG